MVEVAFNVPKKLSAKTCVEEVKLPDQGKILSANLEGVYPFKVVNEGVVVAAKLLVVKTKLLPAVKEVEATGIGNVIMPCAPKLVLAVEVLTKSERLLATLQKVEEAVISSVKAKVPEALGNVKVLSVRRSEGLKIA